MVFSSQIFLFYFLPTFLVGYFVLFRAGVKHSGLNFFITIFSYIFYGWLGVPRVSSLLSAIRTTALWRDRKSVV